MKYYIPLLLLISIFSCKKFDEKSSQPYVPTSTETSESSDEVIEWLTFKGDDDMPHIVLVSGDEEYRSEEAMPQLARILSEHQGFNCTVLFAQDPANPGVVDPNYTSNIPGLEHLASADMMVLFTRFRSLPDDQMKYFDDYLKSGKPILGIRTSTHAFNFDKDSKSSYKHYGNYHESDDEWDGGFGRLVLGEHWIAHYGKHGEQSTRGIVKKAAELHDIVNGIEPGDMWGPTDVYATRLPLPQYSRVLVLGEVVNRTLPRDDNDPLLGMRPTDRILPGPIEDEDIDGNKIMINVNDVKRPIVWTNSYQVPGGERGKSITSTIGASVDMLSEGVRRVMVNSILWGLERDVPEKTNVALIGSYNPTRFAFHKDEYWDEQNMKISSLVE